MNIEVDKIHQLAKLYGIQGAYYDVFKKRRLVRSESLLAILKSMNVEIESSQDLKDTLHQQIKKIWQRLVSPVTVAWNGKLNITLSISEEISNTTLHCHIICEDLSTYIWKFPLKEAIVIDQKIIDGKKYLKKSVHYSKSLPYGYHRLIIQHQNQTYSCLIVSAPRFAYEKPKTNKQKSWGLFAPVYSLHSQHSFGAGDISDFNRTVHWVAEHGGNLVGTLPLFAAFLQKPCEPSPYSPISKFFFNEFYLDVKLIPEFQHNKTAQNLLNSSNFQRHLKCVRETPIIDYQKIMMLKRKIIEVLANEFFTNGSVERHRAFIEFCNSIPNLSDYANFRAVQESLGKPWPQWPQTLRAGIIYEGDYDPHVKKYHMYVQWQIHQQIKQLAESSTAQNIDLYLDMPLGVHPHGYDVWRNRDLFALDLMVGAPVDAVYPEGQNWGFPPLIPYKLRENHYYYFIQSLRKVLPYVNLLRIDHVMGLHRLYCIPSDFKAKDGAFIRYPAEEMYAIISIESQRYKTCVIGENLGTVPHYVNKAMAKHRLYRMYVLQYEINSAQGILPKKIPVHSIATLNTHDMPPFAAYAQGLDIKDRRKNGALTKEQAMQEWHQRKVFNPLGRMKLANSRLQYLLQDCLYKLAASRSQFLMINLEDLWLEVMPQNIPVSGENYPNWRRRFKLSYEQWRQNRFLCATLSNIAMLRKKRI